jgi:hypothetical protein
VDLGPALLIGFAWVVISAIRKAGGKPPGTGTSPRRLPGTQGSGTASARPGTRQLPGARALPVPPVGGPDATQREGSQLEALLRELGRTLEQGSGPVGRPPDRRLPPAEDVEERGSLEVAPEVQSLERDPKRQARVEVDQDDEAERIVARRMAAAEAQGKPLTKADHRAFDERIRQEAADKTATKGYTARQLREAVVWREILGPPVSLRGEGEER